VVLRKLYGKSYIVKGNLKGCSGKIKEMRLKRKRKD